MKIFFITLLFVLKALNCSFSLSTIYSDTFNISQFQIYIFHCYKNMSKLISMMSLTHLKGFLSEPQACWFVKLTILLSYSNQICYMYQNKKRN